jgi:hypothetical protein
MSDRWTTKVKKAVTSLHGWTRRERALAARIAAAHDKPKTKATRRSVELPKGGGD